MHTHSINKKHVSFNMAICNGAILTGVCTASGDHGETWPSWMTPPGESVFSSL
jgi:hypothetical protein